MAAPPVSDAGLLSSAVPKAAPMPPPLWSADQGLPPVQALTGASVSAAFPVTADGAGELPLSESNPQDTPSGSLRDGRARDPVPSKLKGKTDGSKGNFGIMHVEVTGRGEATDRDAEAKRTSESTELAAKRAFESGYVSLRRSRFVHLPEEPAAKPFIPPSTPDTTPSQSGRRTPLGPEETKSEQARLLTLLRSLHPMLVVDQVCKALAFFGGIPGAPPPADGGFPESAEANGSGSLFVGWIAEIFPKLGGNSVQQAPDQARQPGYSTPVRRRPGRPRGSKATKTRKDKGVKKGPKKPLPSADQRLPTGVPHETWVSIDGDEAPTDDVEADSVLPPPVTNPRTQLPNSHSHPGTEMGPPGQLPTATPRTTLPDVSAVSGITASEWPSTRKRGRPKGSKNRPKSLVAKSGLAPGEMLQEGSRPSHPPQTLPQVPETPRVDRAGQSITDSAAVQSFTAVNSASPASAKKRPRKTKGQRPRPSSQGQVEQIASGSDAQGDIRSPGLNNGPEYAAEAPIPRHQTPQGYQPHGSGTQALVRPTTHISNQNQTKAPSKHTGQKRKRKYDGDGPSRPLLIDSGHDRSSTLSDANAQVLPYVADIPGLAPPVAATPAPASKRRRKTKELRLAEKESDDRLAQSNTNASAPASSRGLASHSDPNQISKTGQAPTPASPHKSGQAMVPVPLSGSPATSIHQSQPRRFDLQPPTMDNLGVQLHAQFREQSEVELQALAAQSAPEPALFITNRLSQQQQMQHHKQPQGAQPKQRQQEQQQQQQQHLSSAPTGLDRSPDSQSAAARLKPAKSPLMVQNLARPGQGLYSQYRSSSSQYRKQQEQEYTTSQAEQPQQPQQQQQHRRLAGSQQRVQPPEASPAQSYSTSTPRPQQYVSHQQALDPGPQQYSGGQELLDPQQRYQQQLAASSVGAASHYVAQQATQFSTSASDSFGAAEVGYRDPMVTAGNASYDQRNQPRGVSLSAAASFRPPSAHAVPQHSQPFSTGATDIQQRGAGHATSQTMHGLGAVQTFTGTPGADWSLFDTSHLGTPGAQGTMGLGNAGYGISASSVRASSTTGPGFPSTGLTSFGTSGLGGGERYYGVGRR